MRAVLCAVLVVCAAVAVPTGQQTLPRGPIVALTHVRVIDGNGGPAVADQTIVIDRGRISAVGRSTVVHPPTAADSIDLSGRTVLPGLVGMHEHLFYQLEPAGGGEVAVLTQRVFAKLYLAAGVTTIRTAGTVDFDGDARLKRRIDAGAESGPAIHLTSPYLNAPGAQPDPAAIARAVTTYADAGATSFKAYTSLRASELKAAIETAHARGLQVTGHLCAVGFREAAALGVDNVEHGIAYDADLYYDKRPDECPDGGAVLSSVGRMNVGDSEIRDTITQLVNHGVAVTSTLAVIESYAGAGAAFDPRVRPLLTARLQATYDSAANRLSDPNAPVARMFAAALKTEMAFERAFVAAGGKLLAGVDPTGWGGVVAGFGDQRELELLVDAGFRPEQAIEIATRNGARFMNEQRIGTIEPGMQADLVVVRGDVSSNMSAVRNVEMVFKNGVAYDPTALVATARGQIGALDWTQFLSWPVVAFAVLASALIANRARRGKSRASIGSA